MPIIVWFCCAIIPCCCVNICISASCLFCAFSFLILSASSCFLLDSSSISLSFDSFSQWPDPDLDLFLDRLSSAPSCLLFVSASFSMACCPTSVTFIFSSSTFLWFSLISSSVIFSLSIKSSNSKSNSLCFFRAKYQMFFLRCSFFYDICQRLRHICLAQNVLPQRIWGERNHTSLLLFVDISGPVVQFAFHQAHGQHFSTKVDVMQFTPFHTAVPAFITEINVKCSIKNNRKTLSILL